MRAKFWSRKRTWRTRKGPKPTACYRCDGRGILVGTSNGALKALDPRTLADVQTMRFGKDAVTM